jgi:cyclase
MNKRIIARLDIKGPNLVKGIHLEGLRVLGKPEHFSRFYYEQGADELLYMDVVASLYNRNSLHEIITRTAKEIFIPITVGGGLRTVDDIRAVLRAGADKVSINTAALKKPAIIREASRRFGSSTIVVSIEAIRHPDGTYFAYIDNGREFTGVNALEWAVRVEELGAGEICLTSVDQEGTGGGFDLELTKRVCEKVSIPVIACGGAGSVDHVVRLFRECTPDAVALSSILHYHRIAQHGLHGDFKDEGNIEFLKKGTQFTRVVPAGLPEIKHALKESGLDIRCVPAV